MAKKKHHYPTPHGPIKTDSAWFATLAVFAHIAVEYRNSVTLLLALCIGGIPAVRAILSAML